MLCEVTIQRQKGYVILIYPSPSQATVEIDEFLSNFEKLLNFVKQLQPSFTIILGNFNVRSKSWWPDDVTSPQGIEKKKKNPSLHPNCHHHIIYCKVNLIIEYLPPYERSV